jgi:uncharacterized membrane protein (DUF485 family)
MVATLIGLVVIVAFVGFAWLIQRWVNTEAVRPIDFTEALFIEIIVIAVAWVLIHLANDLGNKLLNLF